MHSTAPDVHTYLQQVPVDRVACLTELRQLCLNTLIEYEERMEYGMPCYKKNGTVEVAFASQKRYIALYIAKQTSSKQFDQHMHNLIEHRVAPSLAVTAVRGSNIVVADGYGRPTLGKEAGASAETVYLYGSMTKLFTATAVMH